VTTIDLTLGVVSGITAIAASLWWILREEADPPTVSNDHIRPRFELDGTRVLSVNDAAQRLLTKSQTLANQSRILSLLSDRYEFSDHEELIPTQDGTYEYQARSTSDHSVLSVNRDGTRLVLEIKPTTTRRPQTQATTEPDVQELNLLRDALNAVPIPVWKLDESGGVSWRNRAFSELLTKLRSGLPRADNPLLSLCDPPLARGAVRRLRVPLSSHEKYAWFDIQRSASASGDFYTAQNANAVVRAEAAQRNFVQTLSKTFAHLPTGLAIFDANRQLMLFNPALIELTGLGAEFLSSRPNLLSFFDELRDKRLMPEPKNYGSWRQQIADLVAAASDGRYCETWTLDAGRTYRVNGRPHPDGAIAFLLEDISSEVSLTRQFRAKLELNQSVLDQLDSAISVFNPDGTLALYNCAYQRLWGSDPDSSFAEVTILDCVDSWEDKCEISSIWPDVHNFVLNFGDRKAWTSTLKLVTGESIEIRMVPLASGAAMIQFVPMRQEVQREPKRNSKGSLQT